MKKLGVAMLVLGGLSQLGATDCGEVLRDPGFDLWCGEVLCSWKVVRGEARRVGTWHENDSGIELVGPDSAISQTSPVNSSDGSCIKFSLVTNVEEAAEVFLDVDLEADGTVERSERIPTAKWQPVSFLLAMKPPYDGIRFEIRKRGTGTAVLAQIDAETSTECGGLEPIDPGPRPVGAGCLDAADCASSLCGESSTGGAASGFGVCLGCDATHACNVGETCGVGDALSATLAVPTTCVPTGSRALAERCLGDAECASGKCSNASAALGTCSACEATSDCGGAACGPAWSSELGFGIQVDGPSVCRPGEHAGITGGACGADADCASNHCAGTPYKQCSDGRPCETPANCPVGNGLAPGACTPVGIQCGRCD